ncbi:hypothetical protein [Clostridium sp. Marseille-P2415]|uniref:hypothetical protein n=1 Tax=Clostridium sp. Marseille-P2415 TaxID=1805471 RepID=UPI0009886171|nr:hypothetical protein [Clostridium sp. Marseille-P2415]
MKKLHKIILVLCVIVISALAVSCKKEKVEYPPLLTEEEVLERLKETYGEEFEIRSKRDLLSLGKWIHAPGPYSDLAEGLVYEASPESDPSFVFNVYTYRCYGNASPIPFDKSGGLQADLEYHDCYGQDLLEKRFKEKAKKYGIAYTITYDGFYEGYRSSEEAYIARIKDEYEEFSKDFIDTKDYHTSVDFNIFIREEKLEEMAEKISLCVTELMEEYHYEPWNYDPLQYKPWQYIPEMDLQTSIIIDVKFIFKDREESSFLGRNLFYRRWGNYSEDGDFDISKELLISDMKKEIQEEKNRLQK